MHEVRNDVVEQPLVVGHHDEGVVLAAQLVHAAGHNAQCIDIKAAVCLIEDAEFRLEHRHLEDLVPLLLTTTEANVQIAVHQFRVHLHELRLLTHHGEEILAAELGLAARLAALVHRGAQEVQVAHTRDLHRVLEGEKDPFPRALFWSKLQKVFPEVCDASTGDFVLLPSSKNVGEGAFSGAVRSHDGVYFAGLHFQSDALEDALALDAGMQVVDLQHVQMHIPLKNELI